MKMFLIGLMVGGTLGVIIMCLMVVAGDADRRMEQLYDAENRGGEEN